MRYKIKCIPVDIKDNRPVYEVEHIYYVTGRKEAVKKAKELFTSNDPLCQYREVATIGITLRR